MPKHTFEILAYFLSMKGRMTRAPYIGFTLLSYALFFACIEMWAAHTTEDAVRGGLYLLTLLIFPLKFIGTAKRFHDLNLSSLFGLPLLLAGAAGFYNAFVMPGLNAALLPHAPGSGPYEVIGVSFTAGLMVVTLILLTDLALMIVPGTRGDNAYGPDMRGALQAMSEIF